MLAEALQKGTTPKRTSQNAGPENTQARTPNTRTKHKNTRTRIVSRRIEETHGRMGTKILRSDRRIEQST